MAAGRSGAGEAGRSLVAAGRCTAGEEGRSTRGDVGRSFRVAERCAVDEAGCCLALDNGVAERLVGGEVGRGVAVGRLSGVVARFAGETARCGAAAAGAGGLASASSFGAKVLGSSALGAAALTAAVALVFEAAVATRGETRPDARD